MGAEAVPALRPFSARMVRAVRNCEILSGARHVQGIFTALITPFSNGAIDEKAFQDFVEWQIAEGSHGLVPVGTTANRRRSAMTSTARGRLCVEAAKGRCRHRGTAPTPP